MSEADKGPSIRLSVDQEVFIDSVRDKDTIEDATVATEVTSFDRAGDAYVLEGAIVFAGYLTQANKAESFAGENVDSLSMDFDHGQYARHVHHRMPFVLRVPTKSQPRGIVNVASRIAAWKLEVISAGWVRVNADLTITGLNGSQGYHFQCGAQETGDLFFDKPWESADEDAFATTATDVASMAEFADAASTVVDDENSLLDDELAQADAVEQPNESEEVEQVQDAGDLSFAGAEAAGWMRGSKEEREVKPALGNKSESDHVTADYRGQVESVSQARGGHVETGFATAADHIAPVGKDELLSLDRAIHGDVRDAEATDEPAGDTNEFEFEHQVSASDLLEEPEAPEPASEEFVASRGFDDDGFTAAAGFVPTVRVGSDYRVTEEDSNDAISDYRVEGPDPRSVPDFSSAVVDKNLWSFVDFNGPDTKYTLRYVIVMEEETLDILAERVGCTKTDLMRTNRLDGDAVRPGQSLRLPGSAHAATR